MFIIVQQSNVIHRECSVNSERPTNLLALFDVYLFIKQTSEPFLWRNCGIIDRNRCVWLMIRFVYIWSIDIKMVFHSEHVPNYVDLRAEHNEHRLIEKWFGKKNALNQTSWLILNRLMCAEDGRLFSLAQNFIVPVSHLLSISIFYGGCMVLITAHSDRCNSFNCLRKTMLPLAHRPALWFRSDS